MQADNRRELVLRAVRLTILALVVLAGLAYVLNRKDSGVVGSNSVRPLSFVGKLKAGDELCQLLGTSSRRPASVLMTLGLEGSGPQPLRTRVRGLRPISVLRRYSDGVVSFPLPTVRAESSGVFCLLNGGSRPVSVAGEAGGDAHVNGRAVPFSASFTLVAMRRRWKDRWAELFERVGFARGELSGALVVGVIGLLTLGALVLTAGSAWRYF